MAMLGVGIGGLAHHGTNATEHGADAAGNAGHYGPGRYGNETRHEGVFDEVLAAAITPGANEQKKSSMIDHNYYSFVKRLPDRNRLLGCSLFSSG
jgi:hypothetical protein